MESSMDPMEVAFVNVALRDVEPAFGYIAEAAQLYRVLEGIQRISVHRPFQVCESRRISKNSTPITVIYANSYAML